MLLELGKKTIQKNALFFGKLLSLSKINDKKLNKIKKIKTRNPGIDFVRILSMYAIIIHHIIFFGNLSQKYYKFKELDLMNISCFWHVSSFALISGYIGYKTSKYSNLIYLWVYAFFYSLGIIYIYGKYNSKSIIEFKDYFPFYFDKYWYFTKYFGMYLFLPVINKGILSLNQNELRLVVISLILVYVILKDIINPHRDILKMNKGYSVIWLLIFYITGAYFGKFRKEYNGIKKIIFIIICILIFSLSTYYCFYFKYYSLDNSKGPLKKKIIKILKELFILRISSLPMILQSISITLLLTQMKYKKYLTKIIIFLGPLTFGVYIIHMYPITLNLLIRKYFEKEPNNISLSTVMKLILIRSLQIFGICFIIDYLRYILFLILRIRKLCILIEKFIYRIF